MAWWVTLRFLGNRRGSVIPILPTCSHATAYCRGAPRLPMCALALEIRGVPALERESIGRDLLRRVGLAGFESAYPKALSHGMRQRCALARTFALGSPVFLMDEPFGALDAQTKLQLEDVLLDLWSDARRTVVFVTHDLADAGDLRHG